MSVAEGCNFHINGVDIVIIVNVQISSFLLLADGTEKIIIGEPYDGNAQYSQGIKVHLGIGNGVDDSLHGAVMNRSAVSYMPYLCCKGIKKQNHFA